MNIGSFFLLLAANIVALSTDGAAQAATTMVKVNGVERPAYKEGEVLVKFRDGAARNLHAMTALYDRLQAVNVQRFSGAFASMENISFNIEGMSVEEAVSELSRDPSVEFAQPNYMLYAFEGRVKPKALKPCWVPGIPLPPGCSDGGDDPEIQPAPADVNPPVADPDLAQAYGLGRIKADQAWNVQKGSRKVVVAVIDTGVDYNHPDLAANMWRNPKASAARNGVDPYGDKITGDVVGYDFVNNDNLPFDDNQHGTHCAGTIGAVGGDGRGLSGVNQRVSIMAVKFLSGSGSGTTADAVRGIDYAVSRGAKVLSNSWGGPADGNNEALREAIARAEKAGVLVVAAAGNDGTDNDRRPTYPASFSEPNMITVAATDSKDAVASFSNYGAKGVHVGAPGVGIYSLAPGGKYQKLSGTSMACPHVAGAAALVWAQYPNADYKEIKRRLLVSGDELPELKDITVTGKRINVLRALDSSI